MATKRPKYTAACNFSAAGHHFTTGDPVEHPVVLAAVLAHGDEFVTTNTRRAKAAAQSQAEADPPAEETTTSPTEAPS